MLDWLFGRKKEPEIARPEPDARTTPSFDDERLDSRMPPLDTERLESQLDSLHQQITRLVDEAGMLQEQLDRLDHRTSFGNDQLEILIQHLSSIADWAGPLDRRLAELVTWAEQSREGLAQLEEGIRKLSRTQFKTNSLAEAQQERLQSALETLQELAVRKQEAAEQAREQQREAVEAARREARVAMVVDLFPALDGLESALESGRAMLVRSRQPAPKPNFATRLAYLFGLRDVQTASGDTHALAAWLDGLELVRERFLALLRAEGIQPIRAEGQPFDPHRHVAIEAVERSDVPPGTVVEEHRPGYRLGDRVLRYAEVVVTRDSIEGLEGDEKPVERPAATSEAGQGDREPEETDETEEVSRPVAKEREGIQEPETEEQPEQTHGEVSEPVDPSGEAQATAWVHREDRPAEGVKKDSPPQDATDETREVDPVIEEMIARFEARQRQRRS